MDKEQVAKKLEWLDDERRKDRKVLTVLEERMQEVRETSNASAHRLEKIESDLTELRALLLGRLEQLEEGIPPLASEVNRFSQEQTRQAEKAREADRVLQVEQEGLGRAIGELRKSAEIVPRLLEESKHRKDEEQRLSRALNTLDKKMESALEAISDREQTMIKVQEGYRKDSKRVADIQTEITDIRRRVDEHNGKLAVVDDVVGRNETRVSELVALENERRLAQTTWIEQQTVAQAERERKWKAIVKDVDEFRSHSDQWSEDMGAYQETHREMVKALDTFYENLERIDRRISETMEVQRLSEERFRQDWSAFLADEQKKWTTHMLLRDEQWRENERHMGKLVDRISAAEADLVDLEEAFRDKNYSEQARLQALYNWVREAMAEFDETLTKVR